MHQLSDYIQASIIEGHQIASGANTESPFKSGSVEMQAPYFLERGLDISVYYAATINLSISPRTFNLYNAEYKFKKVHWCSNLPSEDFSFSKCGIGYQDKYHSGLIYYPHPETKVIHFQSRSAIETLMPFIPNLAYGTRVDFYYNPEEIEILDPN